MRHLCFHIPVVTMTAVLAAMPMVAVGGATCSVPGSYATIQAAVADPSCSDIVVASGTYFENVTVARSVVIAGSGVTVNGGGSGAVVTVDGSGQGGITVQLSGLTLTNGLNRFGGGLSLTSTMGHPVTVHGQSLTITGNAASTTSLSGFGGGVYVDDFCTLHLSGSNINGNTANARDDGGTGSGSGGGLYVGGTDAVLTLSSSSIYNNLAVTRMGSGGFAAGGGLRLADGATATLTANIWTDNVARLTGSDPTAAASDAVAEGGAIAVLLTSGTGSLHVTGDVFGNNIADLSPDDLSANEFPRGGAVSLLASNTAALLDATFIGVQMSSNVAKEGAGAGEGRGGALAARGFASLVVRDSVIKFNRADDQTSTTDLGFGGGIYAREPFAGDNGFVEITNSMITHNEACNHPTPAACNGDQVFIDFSNSAQNSAQIVNSTVATAGVGVHEGFFFFGPTSGDRLLALNSIFANHAVGIHNVTATGFSRGRYNLYSGNTLDKSGTAFAADDPSTNLTGNASFVNPAIADFHIGSDSDALDLGRVEDVSPFTYTLTADFEGDPRATSPGAMVDSGADELNVNTPIFTDDFESESTGQWSSTVSP